MAANPTCCGQEMRVLAVATPDPTGLLALLCGVCHRTEWRRDGRSVTAAVALETAVALDELVERVR